MKRIIIAAGLVLFVIMGWVLVVNKPKPTPADTSNTQTQTPVDSNTGTANVTIQNFAYSASKITVKKGTRVTWTNQDNVEHNVVSDTDSPQKGLAGPLLPKGQSYSFTFDTVGTYNYHCSPHPYMKATVEVTD